MTLYDSIYEAINRDSIYVIVDPDMYPTDDLRIHPPYNHAHLVAILETCTDIHLVHERRVSTWQQPCLAFARDCEA